jgi:serine/threonine protein kinase
MSSHGDGPSREIDVHNVDPEGSTLCSLSSRVFSTLADSEETALPMRADPSAYRLERTLGAGGMGEVFAARHIDTGELVALKVLSATTATRLYRFKREFRALADVTHRNLVRLGELVIPESGSAFFTMELIDGRSFVDWVRESTPVRSLPDLDRLGLALRQLVEAVSSLHARGYVHRDLKPANVLVTNEGRVVVLDFGLVSEISDRDPGITRDHQILGTPSFMAPEQTLAKRAGPEADFYAIGVMLYQCMTGLLPHRGPTIQLLLDKQNHATPDPADEVSDAPDWLRSLCFRLLARNPDARPDAREILASLEVTENPDFVLPQFFVGRERELAELHAALRATNELRTPVIVHVRAHSGHGKSALVRQFRSQLHGTEVTVLHGRCGKNETLPYKGVDAIVDHLSVILRRLAPSELAELRPTGLGALVAMFPVLDEIWAHSLHPADYGLDEIRRLGAASLRELLVRLARRHPVIVHIDDFQWADLDSVQLLKSVTRPPDAPVLLLLLAYRSEARESQFLQELASDTVLGDANSRIIEFGQLSRSEACELASSLLQSARSGQRDFSSSVAESIAFRSRGSPLFIIQTVLGGHHVDLDHSDVERLVASRLDGLEAAARGLLDTVAVFGAPVPIALALELRPDATEATIWALCEQGLLVRDATGIETAHDRVREVALAKLGAEARARQHWEIGQRLRTELGEGAGDRIYVVVNHLDAGVVNADALSLELRLELAVLNLRAGEGALQSTAWVTAQRYFGYAYRLIEPWLADARQGQGQHHLCLAIVFGFCQVGLFLDSEGIDDLVDDLVRWSLSMTDYCRIAQWYCEAQFVKARFPQVLAFGLPALDRIGFRVPSRPSWPRAIFAYYRGWRAIWGSGFEQIMAKPSTTDPRVRAGLEVAAITTASAGFAGPRSLLTIMGAYGMMLTQYGLHDWAAVAWTGLAVSAIALGRNGEAREIIAHTEKLVEVRSTSASAHCLAQTLLIMVSPSLYSVGHVILRGESAYERARDVGQKVLIQPLGLLCVASYLLQGTPVSKIDTFLASLRNDASGSMFTAFSEQLVEFERATRALIEGRSQLDLHGEPGSSLTSVQRGAILIFRIMVAVSLGEREGSWDLVDRLARDFPSDLELIWPTAVYTTMSVIVIVDRLSACGTRERRQMLRRIRKHQAAAVRWSRRCPENFQPMLDLVDAELAVLAGRYADAVSAYERAREAARLNQMTWLRGLASERLGRLAIAHGHILLAEAAFDAAHEAYEAWGAIAVIRRLDQDRKAALPNSS